MMYITCLNTQIMSSYEAFLCHTDHTDPSSKPSAVSTATGLNSGSPGSQKISLPIQNSHQRHRKPPFEVAKSNPNQNDRTFESLCLKIYKNSAFSHLKPQPNPGKSTRRPVRLDHATGLTSDDTPLQMEGCVRSKSRVSQFKGIHQESPLTIVEKCNDYSGLSRININQGG